MRTKKEKCTTCQTWQEETKNGNCKTCNYYAILSTKKTKSYESIRN